MVDATLKAFRLHLLGDPTFLEPTSTRSGSRPRPAASRMSTWCSERWYSQDRSVVPGGAQEHHPARRVQRPACLDITPEGVRWSFSLALPDLAVGVFALQNLSLGAGFALPFVGGALTVSFEFCKREEPFFLTVSLFGGGGFFGLTIDPNGIQVLEAALEFGASYPSTSASPRAGCTSWPASTSRWTAQGMRALGVPASRREHVGAGAHLGIDELNLSFTYKEPDKAYGRGRRHRGDRHLPFLDLGRGGVRAPVPPAARTPDAARRALMKPDAWREYCDAYA